jgi:hypothetical protein
MHPGLQNLLERVSTFEFEEFGEISLESIKWRGFDLSLEIRINFPEQFEVWDINCSAVRDSLFRNSHLFGQLSLVSEHPLLLPYKGPQVELYFHGRPAAVDTAVGQLLEAHVSITSDWFSLDQFMNIHAKRTIAQLLSGGFGKFADGPKPVIDTYARVLESHHVKVSSPPPRPAMWWDGIRFIPEQPPLPQVLLLDDSYVVAPAMMAERRLIQPRDGNVS